MKIILVSNPFAVSAGEKIVIKEGDFTIKISKCSEILMGTITKKSHDMCVRKYDYSQ